MVAGKFIHRDIDIYKTFLSGEIGNPLNVTVLLDVYDNNDEPKFSNCRFHGNSGSNVNAFQSKIRGLTTQTLTFNNCVFTRSFGTGAVVKITADAENQAQATINFNNCSVGGNSKSTVPLILPVALNGATVLVKARNSIFYNPDAVASELFASEENSDTTIDLDYCFLGEANCAAITKTGTTVNCGSNMFYNTDPKFADPVNGILLPLSGSPVINSGDPVTAINQDYRGSIRPIGIAPDIGAYEFPSDDKFILSIRFDANQRAILSWPCLVGEKFTLRRTTDNLSNFTTQFTGYPGNGATGWTQTYTVQSVHPTYYYQVVRESP